MPIFSSILPQTTPLRLPSEPSAFTRNFGTMKSEMPFVPCGAPSMRAMTRWMMFDARSCSPAEMKIFWPVMRYVPSPCGIAFVRNMPRSVPQCGSVRFIVPVHSPVTSFGRYCCFCSSLACVWIAAYAPCDRPGYMPNAMFADDTISFHASDTMCGMPWPPYTGSLPSAGQPPSTSCL